MAPCSIRAQLWDQYQEAILGYNQLLLQIIEMSDKEFEFALSKAESARLKCIHLKQMIDGHENSHRCRPPNPEAAG